MFRNIVHHTIGIGVRGQGLDIRVNKVIYLFLLYSILTVSVSYGAVPWTGVTNPPETKTKYYLHTGYIFDAALETAIFSYNLESPVLAITEYDVVYLNKIMVPKGTKLVGYASVLKSDDRVNVFFHTLVFPNGQEIKFQGLGLHTDGSAGIPGEVKKYRETVPAKILLETLGNVAVPGIGGAIVKGLTAEGMKEMAQYRPTYSITVKKSSAIQVYVVERVEY